MRRLCRRLTDAGQGYSSATKRPMATLLSPNRSRAVCQISWGVSRWLAEPDGRAAAGTASRRHDAGTRPSTRRTDRVVTPSPSSGSALAECRLQCPQEGEDADAPRDEEDDLPQQQDEGTGQCKAGQT